MYKHFGAHWSTYIKKKQKNVFLVSSFVTFELIHLLLKLKRKHVFTRIITNLYTNKLNDSVAHLIFNTSNLIKIVMSDFFLLHVVCPFVSGIVSF